MHAVCIIITVIQSVAFPQMLCVECGKALLTALTCNRRAVPANKAHARSQVLLHMAKHCDSLWHCFFKHHQSHKSEPATCKVKIASAQS